MTRKREQELKAYYDNKLTYYSPANFKDMTRIMSLVGVPRCIHHRMLDVGCGDGRALDWAYTHGFLYTGIDYSQARITKAHKSYSDYGDQDFPLWIAGDLYEILPLMKSDYELIWCCELLEHLEQPELVWAEMKRLCTGKVVCTCPVNMPYKSHLQVFKDDADLHAMFPDITRIHRIHCATPGGKQREHFVFTYEVPQ